MHTINFKKVRLLMLVCCLAVCALSGCQSNAGNAAPAVSAPREATDDLGRRVRVPERVERVISLAPSLTENVFAVGAGDKLVGRTSFCNYPAEAKAVTEVGDTLNPSLERIVALKPQLVLTTTASQLESFTRRMEEQGIAVFVTDPRDLDGVLRNLRQIGELLGATEQADRLVNDLQTRINAVETRVKNESPAKVFVQISREPLYTIGKTSFVTDLIKRAGGKSVSENISEAYPRFSDEAALASQPEVVILTFDDSMGAANVEVDKSLRNAPAARNNRIYKINGDLIARPSPRLIDGLERVAKSLYPNVF